MHWKAYQYHVISLYICIPGISGKARTFEIVDDSMTPFLHFGDWVSCTPLDIKAEILQGTVIAAVARKSEVIINFGQSFRDGLKLVPHNFAGYYWQMIPYSEILEVWEAKVKITKHFLMSSLVAESYDKLNEPPEKKYVRKK